MSIDQVYDLAQNNVIYDVFSILISTKVIIGKGNTFYPNVVLECINGVSTIGNNNKFYNGTTIRIVQSELEIGDRNEIGENGISITTTKGKTIIRNGCRLRNNAQIMDNCCIGNGAQVLGNIKMSNCILEDGEAYTYKDPNKRGGVLKGYGIANSLKIGTGEVINGNGIMTNEMIERQEKYHPNWMNEEPK